MVAFERVSSLHLDVSLPLEVVAFGWVSLVLRSVLLASPPVVPEIYLKDLWQVEVCLVPPLSLFLLSSHPLMLQCLVMAGEWLSDLMVFVQLVVCEPSSVFLAPVT